MIKRRTKRRLLLGEVKARPSGKEAWFTATVMNISRGGIGLYATERMKKGEKVAVKISYMENSRLREAEEIPGKVRWVQPIGEHYAIGVMFEEKVTKKTYPNLNRCLAYAAGVKEP